MKGKGVRKRPSGRFGALPGTSGRRRRTSNRHSSSRLYLSFAWLSFFVSPVRDKRCVLLVMVALPALALLSSVLFLLHLVSRAEQAMDDAAHTAFLERRSRPVQPDRPQPGGNSMTRFEGTSTASTSRTAKTSAPSRSE